MTGGTPDGSLRPGPAGFGWSQASAALSETKQCVVTAVSRASSKADSTMSRVARSGSTNAHFTPARRLLQARTSGVNVPSPTVPHGVDIARDDQRVEFGPKCGVAHQPDKVIRNFADADRPVARVMATFGRNRYVINHR